MTRISADVSGELVSRVPRSADDLERDAIRLMEVLETDAATLAIGPVVACSFENSSIDVRFSVEADSSAAIHQQISEVVAILDEAADGQITTSMAPSGQAELACA